jgi:hypothetical protein
MEPSPLDPFDPPVPPDPDAVVVGSSDVVALSLLSSAEAMPATPHRSAVVDASVITSERNRPPPGRVRSIFRLNCSAPSFSGLRS